MKEITQTGHIPIDSIGLIFGKYLRFFKVFFVFYILPFFIIFGARLALNKEKFIALYQNIIALVFAYQTKNALLVQAATSSFQDSLQALNSSPFIIIFNILSWIVMLFCFSCLLVGLKHTFYKELNIIEIAKEGFRRIIGLLWTGFSLWLVMVLGIICLVLIFALPVYILGDGSILLYLPIFVAFLILLSMFVFYIPIHLFSDNNPISSALFSCKTFWGSFGFIIIFYLLKAIVSALILAVLIAIGYAAFFVLHNYIIMILAAILIAIIGLYVGMASFGLNTIATFVAYPELLDEDKIDSATGASFGIGSMGGEFKPLPPEFFSKEAVNKIAQPNNNQVLNNNNNNKPVVNTTSGWEGLSMPSNNHQNNRPFLNQKLDQTEFDKLTSKDK